MLTAWIFCTFVIAEWKSKPQGPSLYQTKDIGYAVINVVSVTSLSHQCHPICLHTFTENVRFGR